MPTVGLLIPEFPQQTHCAMWRVGNAFKLHGVQMQLISTRRAQEQRQCHDFLIEESKRTHYTWPPRLGAAIGWLIRRPAALPRALAYVLGLNESSLKEKLRTLPMILAAADLAAYAHKRGLQAIFVHSCANAAHLVAMSHLMGGPAYALRLGGDPEVYGKDHASKMRRALFIASSAPNYFDYLRTRAHVEQDRLMWTWVGCDLEKFTPEGRSWQRQSAHELHAVTVARLTDTKGHADVLEAIKRLKDRGINVRYTMIGSGPERETLEKQAQTLGISERVVFAGPKSMQQVIEYLRVSDVAILASYGLGEAAPAVLAEAMACGVPMVCTRIGATPLMFKDGREGLLVPQRDPAALARALESLATDEPKRQAMAHAAHRHAAVFDCSETARHVLTYLGLIEGPRRPAPAGQEDRAQPDDDAASNLKPQPTEAPA